MSSKKNLACGLLTTVIALGISASTSQAAVILPATLNADSQVRGGAQGGFNYGASTLIYADNASQRVYLRFALPAFDESDLENATLTLYASSVLANVTINLFGLNDDSFPGTGTHENWVEGNKTGATGDPGELTNSNKPGGSPTLGTNRNQATSIGSFVFTTSAPNVPLNFSNPALVNFLKADTNNSVTFILSASTGVGFYSREHTTLVSGSPSGESTLTLSVVPEPVTLSMLGLGGMALLRRRRAV